MRRSDALDHANLSFAEGALAITEDGVLKGMNSHKCSQTFSRPPRIEYSPDYPGRSYRLSVLSVHEFVN